MRILLLGKNGQVGSELQRTLAPLGEVIALGRAEADLSKPEHLRDVVRHVRPQVIVNAAAYTQVDRAESEPDLAMIVNAVAPGILAEEARHIGAALIHYSTDYVFDGTKGTPYVESDGPNPVNVYGRSKLQGERAIQSVGNAFLILRTSWVYSLRADSFVTKVLHWARQSEVLKIAEDQVGSPTWARMLAEATAQTLADGGNDLYEWAETFRGIYHLAGSGAASRSEWAQAVLRHDPRREEQVVRELQPVKSAEFTTAARRPRCSALDVSNFSATFRFHMLEWEEALRLALGLSAG